jgi:arsenate reductase (thioredoxin)
MTQRGTPKRPSVLFLCGANSCRSHMAEGWARFYGGRRVIVHSAGPKSLYVQPRAIRVMKERGVDISSQWSKTVDKVPVKELDYVITLCAENVCPNVSCTAARWHWPIDDPMLVKGNDAEIMAAFRRTRDQIEGKVKEFLKTLG